MTTHTHIGAGNDPVTKGNVYVKLVKKNEREKGIEQIMNELRAELTNVPGANLSYRTSSGMGGNNKPVIMSVRGIVWGCWKSLPDRVEYVVRTTPGAVDIETAWRPRKPEVRIRIDREKASDLGINVSSYRYDGTCHGRWICATKYPGGRRTI